MTAATLSALLGMLGSLALAIPFFADFLARLARRKRLKVFDANASPNADDAALKRAFAEGELERLLRADPKMAISAMIGAVLLIISFALLVIFPDTAAQ